MNKKQKFPRGSKVKVTKNLPKSMAHFESDFCAIVEYSYAQKYGGNDVTSYSLIQLDKNDNPINSIAWYYEEQLTLVSNDLLKGKEIIEKYNFEY